MSEHITTLSRRSFIGGAAAFGVSTLALSFAPSAAFAVTAAEKQAEAAAVLDKLNGLHERADIASADYFTAIGEQETAQHKMDEAQRTIDSKNSEIATLQDKLGTRARSMYRNGSFTFLDMLLGATTFTAFASNWELLNDINKEDEQMVQQTKTLRAEVEAQKAEYANQAEVAQKKADEAAAAKADADAAIGEAQAVYDALSAEARQLLAEEEAAREAARLAEAQREEAERAERIRQESNSGSNGGESGGTNNSGNDDNDSGNSNDDESSSSGSTNNNNSNSNNNSESSSGSNGSSSGGNSGYSGDNKTQSVTGNVVVDRAYSQLGKPYGWGGSGPESFDCSGFVSYCLTGQYGNRIGTTYTFMGLPQVSNPQPGDICTSSGHCGIYIGGGQMIHAPQTGDVVKVSAVQSNMIFVRY